MSRQRTWTANAETTLTEILTEVVENTLTLTNAT